MARLTNRSVRAAWSSLGWGGRLSLLGLLMATILALVLGIEIPEQARHHLLDGRTAALQSVSEAMVDEGLLPATSHDGDSTEELDEEVRRRLLGGDTVAAMIWDTEGFVVYSTDSALIGSRFPLNSLAQQALQGNPVSAVVSGDEGTHPLVGRPEEVIEHFFPIRQDDEIVGLFEVEQRADSLNSSVADIRRTVWVTISVGLMLLGVVLGSVFIAAGRATMRQQQHTEQMLRQALVAREDERKRIVAALHGDVGQRLYRVLYGLEGIGRKVHGEPDVAAELDRLTRLVKDIDATLRSEMRMLHRDAVHEVGLTEALRDLAETTRVETGLEVTVTGAFPDDLDDTNGGLLFWAAEEAVINARKHAGAATIAIQVSHDEGTAAVEVVDDGTGRRAPKGIGLTTLAERLELAGGGLEVRQSRGKGTTAKAWVPVRLAGR